MQRPVWLVAVVLLLQGWGSAAQRFQQMPVTAPCYTGVAMLELRQDDCAPQMAQMAKLSTPFDPEKNLPWDCMARLAISVEGCMVNIVSLIPLSEQVFNFSCSWIQFQGNVKNATAARVAAWVRPSSVARYILRNTDLTTAANDLNSPPKPENWQLMLEEMISERGSALLADPDKPGMVTLVQNRKRCNTTYEVVSGGVLGVGTVNRTSLGEIVMPSLRPFQGPYIVRGERPRWWLARARAVFIALVVMVSVFGALLLLALGFLFYRLCTAVRDKKAPLRGSPFEDGIARMESQQHDIGQGVSSLENQSRRHGPSGGI